MQKTFSKVFRIITSDKAIVLLSLLYIIIPICFFLIGWLKIPLAIVLCILFVFFIYKLYHHICDTPIVLINKSTKKYWIVTSSVCAFWVYLSGIGGFCYQNGDFWARNPVFFDLSTYSWPIIYNLSAESDFVQRIVGSGNVAFVYYYTWWLPVAGVSKLLHLGKFSKDFLLLCWALLGILLIVYCINRLIGRCSYVTTVMLIGFSGLDAVVPFLKNGRLSMIDHIEGWAHYYFQYTSNTTQLFWVFNQSIPIWLIVGVLLQLKDNKYIAAVSSLVFAYSPWAVFGMVPIAVAGTFKQNNKVKEKITSFLNIFNISVPLVMLLIYGLFYMSGDGSTEALGFKIFELTNKRTLLCNYIVFVFLEAGIYFCVMGQSIQKYKYYLTVLWELMLIPLFSVLNINFNFYMRASIPALFLLMTFVIRFFTSQSQKEAAIRTKLLIAVCIIGMYTPFVEINRSLTATLSGDDDSLRKEHVYSFGNIQTNDELVIELTKEQFFAYDYENSLFFKYLAK